MITCEYDGCGKFHEWFKCGDPIPFKRCAQCKSVYYCSKECQLADWRLHKLCCITTRTACDYMSVIKDIVNQHTANPIHANRDPESKYATFEMIPDHQLPLNQIFTPVPLDDVVKRSLMSPIAETHAIALFKKAIVGVSLKIEELGLKSARVLNIRGLFIILAR